jgi:heat shock protein HtpX
MFSDIPGSTLVSLLVALVPAAYVWWHGGALARIPDDPLLAERLLAHRLRARQVFACAVALLIAGWWTNFYRLFVLTVVVRALAAYPLRRTLNQETWSRLTYLWFFFRLIVATFGFWLLLIAAPDLSTSAGPRDWIAAIILGGVLLLWNTYHADIVRVLLRSRPVNDSDLAQRFDRLSVRAGLRPPKFEVVPLQGGVFANAVALPSLRAPAVLLSSTLLERFDADEVEAVCAHELAHIEHYNPTRLRRLNAAVVALIVSGVALGPGARLAFGEAGAWVRLLWMLVVVSYMVFRARSRQKDETASDLRAVEWTEKPEALIRALVKLHAIGRMPRRWESQFERHATHPSLARRVQAIRHAAGQPCAALESPAVFPSAPYTITFDAGHIRWSEGELATHSVSYSRLTELRLDVRSTTARLIAIEQGGRRWELPVDAAEAHRLQQVLDAIDGNLAHAAVPPTFPAPAVRLACGVVGLFALAASQFAAAIPALLACIQPSRTMCLAAAAGAIAGALVAVRSALAYGVSAYFWPALLLAVSSAVMIGLAWVSRHDSTEPVPSRPLIILGGYTGLAWLLLFSSGGTPVDLYRIAHGSAAIFVAPVALAAGLAASGRRPARRLSLAIGAASIAVFALGTRTFVESFSGDAFIRRGASLPMVGFEGRQIAEVRLPSDASWVRVSRSARSIAFAGDDDEDEPRMFNVGAIGGPYARVAASRLFFVSDEEVLTTEDRYDGTVIRKLRRGSERAAVWERVVEGRLSASYDSGSNVWRLLGTSGDEVVQVEGDADGAIRGERRWALGPVMTRGGWLEPVAVSGESVLVLERRYRSPAASMPVARRYLAPFLYLLTSDSGFETRVWLVGSGGARMVGQSSMNPECRTAAFDQLPLCVAADGIRSTIFRVEADRGSVEPVTSIAGTLHSLSEQAPGWLTATLNARQIALSGDGRQAWELPGTGSRWIAAMAVSERFAAVTTVEDRDWFVRVYERPAFRTAESAQSRR